MFKCELTDSFNRCQYRSCLNGKLYCTARYAGCGFRIEEEAPPEADRAGGGTPVSSGEAKSAAGPASPAVPPYVRKPRWYESYYPDSRPVR